MITVHHLEYSQSFRILWLLEALGAEYDLRVYERDPKTRLAPESYKAVSPLGTAPVITDADVTLSETNAVMDYILDKYDADNRLRPAADTPQRVPYLFWFHAAQGSMMPLLLFHTVFNVLKTRVPFFIKPIIVPVLGQAEKSFLKPRMKAILDMAEKDLEDRLWFAGNELTAADIVMCYGMEACHNAGFITAAHPNCKAWIKLMHDDPAFQRAMEKDGRESFVFSS